MDEIGIHDDDDDSDIGKLDDDREIEEDLDSIENIVDQTTFSNENTDTPIVACNTDDGKSKYSFFCFDFLTTI